MTRLSGIGECVLTMPLAAALRKAIPQAHIAWLVEPPASSLVRGHGCVDQVIVANHGCLTSPSRLRSLRRELKSGAFDIAIDPQSQSKSALLSWFSGARHRIGFAAPHSSRVASWLHTESVNQPPGLLVEAQLRLLQPLGIDHVELDFRFPFDEQAEQQAGKWVTAAHLHRGFAVIHVGAERAANRWSPKRFGRVARYLGRTHELPTCVTWAGDREREDAETVSCFARGHAVLAPTATLGQLAALLRRARLFIGSDSGPLHIAAATQTPCIALHGPTDPSVFGPYGSQHIAVRKSTAPELSRHHRGEFAEAMMRIEVDDVTAACDRICRAAADRQNRAA